MSKGRIGNKNIIKSKIENLSLSFVWNLDFLTVARADQIPQLRETRFPSEFDFPSNVANRTVEIMEEIQMLSSPVCFAVNQTWHKILILFHT